MDDRPTSPTDSLATVDFVDPAPVLSNAEHLTRDEFLQGATWSLRKLAAWLDATNIVSDDERAQQAVNQTKLLIAAQARQAAAELQSKSARDG